MRSRDVDQDGCPQCGGPKAKLATLCQPCHMVKARTARVAKGYPKGTVAVASAVTSVPCPECGGPMQRRSKKCQSCWAAKGRAGDLKMPMGGAEAETYGATVTFETSTGPLTIARVGQVGEAVREACELAVAAHPEALVVCVSTPSSIYTDMHQRGGESHPELGLLTKLGLKQMLHPRLTARPTRASGPDVTRVPARR